MSKISHIQMRSFFNPAWRTNQIANTTSLATPPKLYLANYTEPNASASLVTVFKQTK